MASKQHKVKLAKSIVARSHKRPNQRSRQIKSMEKIVNVIRHDRYDSGYAVDVADLLFTLNRDFLNKNNGQKVRVGDLKGKTIVLYIVPINYDLLLKPGETLDMVLQAYQDLLPLGGFEFVFVPVYFYCHFVEYSDANYPRFESREVYFDHLLSTMPWSAVPFSDLDFCGGRVLETFSVDYHYMSWYGLPYWVIIDPTSTVVATRALLPYLFKIFSGAELYPLSVRWIRNLWDAYNIQFERSECRKFLISIWDQLLATSTRDFLLSSNDGRAPISSLKGKVIGLYLCENVPCPLRMKVIKEAYRKAKLRDYDFEIVQINFHFHCFEAIHTDANLSEPQRYENINWLTLPFKDSSCKKLQRIFECKIEYDDMHVWKGDCLVIVDSRLQTDVSNDQVLFEFSGAEIIELFGIEGYPFVSKTLFEREYTRQKEEVKLQSYFPPGLCHFTRAVCDGGFDLVNGSQLKGKRVLVLFADSTWMDCPFVSTLKSKYREQAEKDMFEVVYVSTDVCVSDDFESECIDMPWLVHPYSQEFLKWCGRKSCDWRIGAVAFDIDY